MKVIYLGYKSTFAALLAARIHIGTPKAMGFNDDKAINEHLVISKNDDISFGKLIYIGLDDGLREVYCLGCKRHRRVAINALSYIRKIFKFEDELHFIDTSGLDGKLPYYIILFYKNNFKKIAHYLYKLWYGYALKRCEILVESEKDKLNSGGD